MVLSFIWDRHHWRPLAAYPQHGASNSSLQQIACANTTGWLYTWPFNPQGLPAIPVTRNAVSSYLTFSLSPFEALAKPMRSRAVWFSVALSVPDQFLNPDLPVRKCGALCCPDFPPRLFIGAIGRLVFILTKIRITRFRVDNYNRIYLQDTKHTHEINYQYYFRALSNRSL